MSDAYSLMQLSQQNLENIKKDLLNQIEDQKLISRNLELKNNKLEINNND